MGRKNKATKYVEVNVYSIGHKGMAIARTDEGEVVFTNAAVPGDRVKVALQKKEKAFGMEKLQKLFLHLYIAKYLFANILVFVVVVAGKT